VKYAMSLFNFGLISHNSVQCEYYMTDSRVQFKNCVILLMSSPGPGKRGGEALSAKSSFRLVIEWYTPILKLLGDDDRVMSDLGEAAWKKMNDADDLILSTIGEVCPKEYSDTKTQMMFDQDPYHPVYMIKLRQLSRSGGRNFSR
jgi:hypothetical protein